MKFNSPLDAQTFLIEIKGFERLDEANEKFKPTNEEMQSFLKARTPLVKKLKNYRKASAQKANWRKNRHKMLKGIKAFHKSVEGKRFHKKLGRFLATRITRKKLSDGSSKGLRDKEAKSAAKNEAVCDMLLAKKEWLTGLNSAKQHLLVELGYFHQLQEQVELEEFITDYAYPFFRAIEESVLTDVELTEDELIFLLDIVESNSVIQSLANKSGQEFAEIEKLWNTIASDLQKDKIDKDDDRFYPFLVTRLKKQMGIK